MAIDGEGGQDDERKRNHLSRNLPGAKDGNEERQQTGVEERPNKPTAMHLLISTLRWEAESKVQIRFQV